MARFFVDNPVMAMVISIITVLLGVVAMSGPDGTLAAFRTIPVRRRIFVHVNNTNPALREGSPERRAVEEAGWEIANDGMDVRP